MTSRRLRRPVQGLIVGCTLLFGVASLPGCTPPEKAEKVEKNVEALAHRPPLVLLVSQKQVTDGKAKATIEMEKIKFGDFIMSDILKQAQDWRLVVYRVNGTYVWGKKEFGTQTTFELENLPLDKMLRANLDLHLKGGSQKPVTEKKTFLALVHVFPDDNPPAPISK